MSDGVAKVGGGGSQASGTHGPLDLDPVSDGVVVVADDIHESEHEKPTVHKIQSELMHKCDMEATYALWLAMDIYKMVAKDLGVQIPMDFAGRRPRAMVESDEDKLERLCMRLRGDTRRVSHKELDVARNGLEQCSHELDELRRNPNRIQELIYQRTPDELQTIIDMMPDAGSGGRGIYNKMNEIFGVLCPVIAQVEESCTTTKTLYSEMVATAMEAFAKAHHIMKGENAQLSMLDFKKAIQGAIEQKKIDEAKVATQQRVQQQMQEHYQTAFQTAVQQEAQRLLLEQTAPQTRDSNMEM
jgi:hypothetical protein